MLVKAIAKPISAHLKLAITMTSNGREEKELETGVYECPHFNFNHQIKHKDEYPVLTCKDGIYFGSFGVCDNYKQVLEQCPMIVESERKFVISVTKISKSRQPPEGGWRWHKWGEYIGTQEPTCEYLYDEPIIEEVYAYHVYEV